jgi:hypothetical protein
MTAEHLHYTFIAISAFPRTEKRALAPFSQPGSGEQHINKGSWPFRLVSSGNTSDQRKNLRISSNLKLTHIFPNFTIYPILAGAEPGGRLYGKGDVASSLPFRGRVKGGAAHV